MAELDLTAEEETPPLALPTTPSGNLWVSPPWVRGKWPASMTMSDPSGVCHAGEELGDQVQRPVPDQVPDRHTWQQCSLTSLPVTFDTSTITASQGVGVGQARLLLLATNAAGVSATPTKTIDIDNSVPTIALSGPVDAVSTAGTQYVTAIAGGSPSGIADIVCSVDGGTGLRFTGPGAQVPVSGVGRHSVSCYAQNNAVDAAGNHGTSAPASWSMKIGQPTVVGIAFHRLVGLSCHRVRARVVIPGRWITITRHGRRVRVRTPSRTKIELVQRCHPTVVRRRTTVFVRVRRRGHIVVVKQSKVVRVVVPPHVIATASQTVAFGHGATVSGWLGTASGQALAGHVVRILTAPANGTGSFSQSSVATTAPDGTWRAGLPRGPSRVVEAAYDGDAVTEGAFSAQARIVVPAQIRLTISPRHVPWGGTVRLTGQLLGGYLPPTGALVRLRIGIGRSYQTYGVDRVTGDGHFRTTYIFGAGLQSVHRTYFFQVVTLPSGDYPYAPGASARRTVAVGGR